MKHLRNWTFLKLVTFVIASVSRIRGTEVDAQEHKASNETYSTTTQYEELQGQPTHNDTRSGKSTVNVTECYTVD